VLAHIFHHPNSYSDPHLYNTALPITAEVVKSSGASATPALVINTSCWDAGIVEASDDSLSYTGVINATGQTVSCVTDGKGVISFNISNAVTSSNWLGTLVLEAHNGDQNWVQVNGYNQYNLALIQITPTSSNQLVYVPCAAYVQVRIRASAWVSNAAQIQINSSPMTFALQTLPAYVTTYAAFGSASPGNASNATGIWDIFWITGSSTRIIKVKHVSFAAKQNTAAYNTFNVIKRSSISTSGTGTVTTNAALVPQDSNDSAATAVVTYVTTFGTVAQTTGTAIGTVGKISAFIPSTTSTINGNPNNMFTFGNSANKPIILNGTSENLAVNFSAVTGGENTASNSFAYNFYVEWTEEV
jgi:hypothetical protein